MYKGKNIPFVNEKSSIKKQLKYLIKKILVY